MNTLTANPLIPVPHRVHAVRKETADTFTLDVAPNEGSPPPQYEPGQFNMLYAFGVGDVPISISGRSPKTGGWLHTVRDVGTVTGALHALKAGQTVGLRGPFGTSWPMPQAVGKDVVIMAGGIGLAPLRPVLEAVVENRDRFGNVSLLYGARNPDGLLFERDRELWRGKH
ncbi:MAG: Ni/Fe hydrogenase subunit gamma, partial [Nitrospina sp.]|nr:Ni/Fe hydrogenase subunit gamma [Nitrospina sp.]